MQELKSGITELEKKIKENNAGIRERLGALGDQLAHMKKEQVAESLLADLYNEIQALYKIEPMKKRYIDEINRLEEKTKGIKQQAKVTKQSIFEKEKEAGLHYKRLGEAAFRIYKNNKEDMEAYKPVFNELDFLDIKLSKANKDLSDTNQASEKKVNFFSQLLSATKSLYIEKKQDLLLARQTAVFKNAGKKIIATSFPVENEDPALSDAVVPLEAILNDIEAYKKEVEELDTSEKEVKAELTELGVKTSAQWKIKELEKEIDQSHQVIREKYLRLGKLYYANLDALTAEPSEIKSVVREIDGLESENKSNTARIVELNARIDIEKLKDKIEKNKKSITGLEKKIEKQKQEIKDLEKDNGDLARDINRIAGEHGISL